MFSGDLERLQRFWMTGTCKPDDHDQNATSDPLALEQFLSAFLLLMGGTLLAALILLLECLYFNFFRKKLAKTDQGGCCALISLVRNKIILCIKIVHHLYIMTTCYQYCS